MGTQRFRNLEVAAPNIFRTQGACGDISHNFNLCETCLSLSARNPRGDGSQVQECQHFGWCSHNDICLSDCTIFLLWCPVAKLNQIDFSSSVGAHVAPTTCTMIYSACAFQLCD